MHFQVKHAGINAANITVDHFPELEILVTTIGVHGHGKP
jgi:hypothetical protein